MKYDHWDGVAVAAVVLAMFGFVCVHAYHKGAQAEKARQRNAAK